MLAGDDQHVKPDRMVLHWIGRHLGRQVDVRTARELITATAQRLHHTPWELDHAIWRAESGRSPRGGSAAPTHVTAARED
jgi:hypothetical protein